MAYISRQSIDTQEKILDLILVDENVEESHIEDYLRALYFIAKTYNKSFSPRKNEQIEFTQKAIEYYDKIIAYCQSNETAKSLIKNELKSSIDAKDLLERQIKTYQKTEDSDENDPSQKIDLVK